MASFVIEGGHKLHGEIHPQGAKNEVLQILCATLLTSEEVRVATPKAKKEIDKLVEEGKVEIIGEVPIKTEPGELEKIVFQILLGVLLGLTGVITTIGGFNLGILAFPVVIIAILGCINCVNLIDGMDGLAAGIVGIASFACCFLSLFIGNIRSLMENFYVFI